jgi:hypothetical protein
MDLGLQGNPADVKGVGVHRCAQAGSPP